MKHTPKPWHTNRCENSIRIDSFHGSEIARVHGTHTLSEDNAQFILTAVNNHYQLLEACEAAGDIVELSIHSQVGTGAYNVLKKLKQAIANAEEEEKR